MENLQRLQAARVALDEKLRQAGKERDLRSMVESQIHQQALAFRHYQATMNSALAAGVASCSPGASLSQTQVCETGEDRNSSRNRSDNRDIGDLQEDAEKQELIGGDVEDCSKHDENREPLLQETCLLEKSAAVHLMNRAPGDRTQKCHPGSPPRPPQPQHHEWTYEEQFKQLYELDDDGKRKEFLDDLFSFMQKRGTPVNRIPIMAKQVLDLYTLYKLVTEKGGLVEVINKKMWREITKGLKLPTSITSAAFTLRTQYMKYLYSYECEKRGLSSPGELQAAIDSNRRVGRRQSYGSPIFNYSAVSNPTLLSLPRVELSHLPISTMSQLPVFKKDDSMVVSSLSSPVFLPLSPSGHHITSVTTEAAAVAQPMAVTQAAAAIQASTLEQRRDKLESSEPPEKKMMGEEQQRVIQQTSKHDMLASTTQLPLSIKFNNSRGDSLRSQSQSLCSLDH
ncbi:AT-rich interactive domain-containing protein 3A [Hippocampus zosterae]|uniref:AT-rich interactive domain-containing protein 3A n=1 Tax=Hippocampus zosterae TaxID=109293 RepID=UPI00223CE0F4|nr:AT-rich interactive domain-containing protein 3A [Hippocampus zosterae]